MRKICKIMILGLAVVSISIAAMGQGAAQQEGVPISVTVTVSSKNRNAPPAIPQNEVVARQDGSVRRVISWAPAGASGAGLDLVVLIDNSVTSNISNRWDELRDFLRQQPANTQEGIAYANFGSARFEQELTGDHDKAAKALRMPGTNPGANTGIYDAGRDLIKRWPASKNRKAVVLISDGLDFNNGGSSPDPDRNPSLESLIEHAQQAGVTFYAIYARGAGEPSQDTILVSRGQGCLDRLAKDTGGESFIGGLTTPVSLEPFLQDIAKELGQQYILTFAAKAPSKAGYSHLKVVVETKNVEILAPDRVYVPGSK
jgi:VWFA-related protein